MTCASPACKCDGTCSCHWGPVALDARASIQIEAQIKAPAPIGRNKLHCTRVANRGDALATARAEYEGAAWRFKITEHHDVLGEVLLYRDADFDDEWEEP